MEYISSYTGDLIDAGVNKGLNIVQLLFYMTLYNHTSSQTQDEEWEWVILDNIGYVLAGKQRNGDIYIATL